MFSFKMLFTATLLTATQMASAAVTSDVFTVNCSPLTVQRSDPIVSPGMASDHVHVITGGTAFQRTMDSGTAINAKATTCDKILDHSNYWVPQMYHMTANGGFEIVPMKGNAAYYMNRACDYQEGRTYCPDYHTNFPAAPPKGLRMVSGNPNLRDFNSSDITQRAINHMCIRRKDGQSIQTNSLPTSLCNTIRSQVTFPPCWNGKDLTAPDFKSHMAFPAFGDYNGGVCPSTHPVAIIQIFFEFFFDTSSFPDRKLVFAQGDRTGYGFHGDFLNGWTDQDRLADALKTCTGTGGVDDPDCSLNVGADGSAGHSSEQKPEVAAPDENIGLNGPIAALPNGKVPTGKPPKKISRVRGRGSVTGR